MATGGRVWFAQFAKPATATAVNADAPDLAAWATWLPPGMRVGGRLAANVSLRGSLATPRWRGALQGRGAGAQPPGRRPGAGKRPTARQPARRAGRWTRSASRDRQGGELSLSGQANWRRPERAVHPERAQAGGAQPPQPQPERQRSGAVAPAGQRFVIVWRFYRRSGRITLPDSDTPAWATMW